MSTSMNPTGGNVAPVPIIRTGNDSGTGGPGNYGFGNSGNPNPTQTSGNPYMPTTSIIPGQQPFNPASPQPYSGDLTSKLNDTFGSGMGALIDQFLKSNGGYNSALTQQAVQAQIAAMQQNIMRGAGNLSSNMGAEGISPNSSSAALEMGDYMSHAVTEENAITAQEYYDMWNSSMGREFSLLEEAGGLTAHHQGKAGDWAQQFQQFGEGLGAMVGGGGFSTSSGPSGDSSSFTL